MAPNEDRSRFMRLYLAAQPPLKGFLFSLLRNAADADDVFQEVSLVLWEKFADYDDAFPFLSWAFGIARNHVARWRRARPLNRHWLPPQIEEKLAATTAELEDELAPRRYEQVLPLNEIARRRGMTLNAVNKALGKIRRFLSDCTGGMTGMEQA